MRGEESGRDTQMGAATIASIKRPRGNRPRPEAATIDDVLTRHRLIAQQAVCGMTPKQIADSVGMTMAGVRNVLRSPVVAQHVKAMQAREDEKAYDVHAEIRALLPTALEVLEESLDAEYPITVRRDTALKLLGMAGYGERKQVHVSGGLNHNVLTQEQIQQLVARAAEAQIDYVEGQLIDDE